MASDIFVLQGSCGDNHHPDPCCQLAGGHAVLSGELEAVDHPDNLIEVPAGGGRIGDGEFYFCRVRSQTPNEL